MQRRKTSLGISVENSEATDSIKNLENVINSQNYLAGGSRVEKEVGNGTGKK